eukprot:gene4765-34516_t
MRLNESPIGLKRKKWGFIATQPGATLQVMLNTTPSVAPQTSTATPNSMQLVKIQGVFVSEDFGEVAMGALSRVAIDTKQSSCRSEVRNETSADLERSRTVPSVRFG